MILILEIIPFIVLYILLPLEVTGYVDDEAGIVYPTPSLRRPRKPPSPGGDDPHVTCFTNVTAYLRRKGDLCT